MTETDAKLQLKAAIEASQVLIVYAAGLVDRLDEDEARTARHSVGHVVAEIGERLIDPIFLAHPALKPEDDSDAWRGLSEIVGARDMR